MKATWLVRFVKAVLGRHGNGNAPALKPDERENIRSILVLRPDERMGNVLLTTPLVKALADAFPSAKIEWLVARRYQWLVRENDLNVQILPFEKRSPWIAPWHFFSLLFKLLSTPYDLVIDASHEHDGSTTAALLALVAGGRYRIGHKREIGNGVYTHAVKTDDNDPPDSDSPAHDSLRKRRLLEPILSNVPEAQPWITPCPNSVKIDVKEWLEVHDIARYRRLGLYLGGRKTDHRWPIEHFVELAKSFGPSAGWRTLAMWGPGEEDLVDLVSAEAKDNLTPIPGTDVTYLQGFMEECDLIVVADTGPLHMAWAMNVPIVSILMKEDGLRWAPFGDRFLTVRTDDGKPPSPPSVLESINTLAQSIESEAIIPPRGRFKTEHFCNLDPQKAKNARIRFGK